MKSLCICLIEEIGCLLMIIYISVMYSDRLKGVSPATVFLISAIAIAGANLAQYFLGLGAKHKSEKLEEQDKMIFQLVSFAAAFFVFLMSSAALKYFCNMLASYRTLLLISLMSAAVHITLNLLPDVLFVADKNSEMYEEKVILPDTLKEIGKCAFEHCEKLEKPEISASMTEIGKDVWKESKLQ